MRKKIVLASNNAGKLVEFQATLSHLPVDLMPQGDLRVDEVPETGLTFVENALIKARHATRATGLPALADDSGLEVAHLRGEPGIYSARYVGNDSVANMMAVLEKLKGAPPSSRGACFHCVIVYLSHELDPRPLICEGTWHGMILDKPQGEGGFGYDPIFHVPERACSAAELSAPDKNSLSHRGKALRVFIEKHVQQGLFSVT